MCGEKITFGGANPQTELFWWYGSFWILDGSSMFQQGVMFWVEWDSVNSTAVWRTHNSCVHLENLPRKSEKLKRHKFPTQRRKFPTKRRNFFGLFSMHIWTLTCYISANVLQGVWLSDKCEKCTNSSWLCKNPAKQLKWKFLAEDGRNFWSDWSDNNFFSLGWPKKFYPPGLGTEVS